MPLDFEKYAMKGNEFLNRLAKKMGDENDRARAARVLRSVLRTLRNHLTVDESMQLLSQLPIAIKGVYVEGWRIHETHQRIKTMEQFATEVLQEEGQVAWRDFSNIEEVIHAIHAVVEAIVSYVSPDEMDEAFGTLPKSLKNILTTWIPS